MNSALAGFTDSQVNFPYTWQVALETGCLLHWKCCLVLSAGWCSADLCCFIPGLILSWGFLWLCSPDWLNNSLVHLSFLFSSLLKTWLNAVSKMWDEVIFHISNLRWTVFEHWLHPSPPTIKKQNRSFRVHKTGLAGNFCDLSPFFLYVLSFYMDRLYTLWVPRHRWKSPVFSDPVQSAKCSLHRELCGEGKKGSGPG